MITGQHGTPPPATAPPALVRIESAPEAIKAARDFVGGWFAGAAGRDDRSYVARLVVTELVTNAYKHGVPIGGGLTIRVYPTEDGAVVEVWDGSVQAPVVRSPDLCSESGRGLAMLAAVVAAWGFSALPAGGKRVWAVIR